VLTLIEGIVSRTGRDLGIKGNVADVALVFVAVVVVDVVVARARTTARGSFDGNVATTQITPTLRARAAMLHHTHARRPRSSRLLTNEESMRNDV
jgi:hypothetical protein